MATSNRLDPSYMSMRQSGSKKKRREIPEVVPATAPAVEVDETSDPEPTATEATGEVISEARHEEPANDRGVESGSFDHGGNLDDDTPDEKPTMSEEDIMNAMTSVVEAGSAVTEHSQKIREIEKDVIEKFNPEVFSNAALAHFFTMSAIEMKNRMVREEEERRQRQRKMDEAVRSLGFLSPQRSAPVSHSTPRRPYANRTKAPEPTYIREYIYQHPDDPSLTWQGTGQHPLWLRDYLKNTGVEKETLRVKNPKWKPSVAETETESG